MATNSDIITHRKLGFALSRISQNTCLEIKNDVAKTTNISAHLERLYCKKKTLCLNTITPLFHKIPNICGWMSNFAKLQFISCHVFQALNKICVKIII